MKAEDHCFGSLGNGLNTNNSWLLRGFVKLHYH